MLVVMHSYQGYHIYLSYFFLNILVPYCGRNMMLQTDRGKLREQLQIIQATCMISLDNSVTNVMLKMFATVQPIRGWRLL